MNAKKFSAARGGGGRNYEVGLETLKSQRIRG